MRRGGTYCSVGASSASICRRACSKVALLAGDDTPDWLTLLRAAGAMESFLRASVQVASPEEIASFLLLDRDFPRSAYYSLAVADRCLDELSKFGPSDRDVNQARLTIRLTQTRLEYMDPSAALRELAEILDLLEQTSADRQRSDHRALLSQRRGDQLGERAGHVSDSMRLRVRHVTGFSYDGAADSSYNEVRMTPLSLPRQRVEFSSLTITPYALQSTYRDYFDTIVTTFDLHESHERLEVVADATVETSARRGRRERSRRSSSNRHGAISTSSTSRQPRTPCCRPGCSRSFARQQGRRVT